MITYNVVKRSFPMFPPLVIAKPLQAQDIQKYPKRNGKKEKNEITTTIPLENRGLKRKLLNREKRLSHWRRLFGDCNWSRTLHEKKIISRIYAVTKYGPA